MRVVLETVLLGSIRSPSWFLYPDLSTRGTVEHGSHPVPRRSDPSEVLPEGLSSFGHWGASDTTDWISLIGLHFAGIVSPSLQRTKERQAERPVERARDVGPVEHKRGLVGDRDGSIEVGQCGDVFFL
ncbi:hypothetical protein VTK73DRAFT_3858 [Phialemonium thermophilum]|uniref:Uncharacterized protein n=1 Tax=Phialemonium thermophilum TaxID=223376 RepID=A0ABR3VFH9_9PEZI